MHTPCSGPRGWGQGSANSESPRCTSERRCYASDAARDQGLDGPVCPLSACRNAKDEVHRRVGSGAGPGHSHPPSQGRAWDPEHPTSRIFGRQPHPWHGTQVTSLLLPTARLPPCLFTASRGTGPCGQTGSLGPSRQVGPLWSTALARVCARHPKRLRVSEGQTHVLHPEHCSPGLESQSLCGDTLARLPGGPRPALGGPRAGTNWGPARRWEPTPSKAANLCVFRRARCQLAGEPRGSGWELAHTACRRAWPGPPLARCCSHSITISPGGPDQPGAPTPHTGGPSSRPGARPASRENRASDASPAAKRGDGL